MNAEKIMADIVSKLKTTTKTIGTNFPRMEEDGKWIMTTPNDWTAGFYPGLLWQAYLHSGEESFKNIAIEQEEMLDDVILSFTPPTHDVGFVWLLTSGQHYKYNKNEKSRRRLLQMANYLAGRFNIKGNFIQAWDGEHVAGIAIIDCMMNLPLLFIASEMLNNPRYAHIAKAHIDTVIKCFIDEDGAVRHQCRFNPETGEFIEALGGQGYSPESSWTRGSSWAIYGFAMAYRYTKDKKYLEVAEKVARFFIESLDGDFAPPWDFRADVETKRIKDVSAGAVAASGLLEISLFAEDKNFYIENAKKILYELYENYSNFKSDDEPLLTKSTGWLRGNDCVEKGLIYADYYFTEAIGKLLDKSFDLPW